jgi:hypothetical protein
VIRTHPGGGLFSLINKVITCMEIYDRVRVDYPPGESLYTSSDDDLWSLLFEPFEDEWDPLAKTDTIVRFPHTNYTWRFAGDLYESGGAWRSRLHQYYSKLKLRPEIDSLSRTIVPGRLADCVSILYRSEHALAMEQRTSVHPSPEQMCEVAEKISGNGKIFVAADTVEAQSRFQARLGDRMLFWPEAERGERMGQSFHWTKAYGSEHIRKMMALALALAKTKHFVHAVSNIATAVLYINPSLPDTFMEVPGREWIR